MNCKEGYCLRLGKSFCFPPVFQQTSFSLLVNTNPNNLGALEHYSVWCSKTNPQENLTYTNTLPLHLQHQPTRHSWFIDTTANFSKSFKGKKATTVKQSLMLLLIKYLNLITPHKHIRSFITNANSSSNLVKIQSYVSKGKGTAAQQFLLFPPATSLPLAWMLFHVL